MRREFVSRWALVDALADDISRAMDGYEEWSINEIATHLIEAGWRPGGDDA